MWFVKTYENNSKVRSQRRTHGYSINLILKLTVKNKFRNGIDTSSSRTRGINEDEYNKLYPSGSAPLKFENRSFKICNNWNYFHNDIESIKSNLIKNAYPPLLIDKVIKKYLNYKFLSNQNQLKDTSDVHYFKLPYLGNLSHHIKNKLLKLCNEFCKDNVNIKLVFTSFKIKNYFSYKNPIPHDLKSLLIYKFTCASIVLAILAKLVVILKLGLRNISERMTSLLFLCIYTPLQHVLTHIILFPLK